MFENVSTVENLVSTNGNIDEDDILVNKKKYNRLVRERDEYRELCHKLVEINNNSREFSEDISAEIHEMKVKLGVL